jgi:hypothetical protein
MKNRIVSATRAIALGALIMRQCWLRIRPRDSPSRRRAQSSGQAPVSKEVLESNFQSPTRQLSRTGCRWSSCRITRFPFNLRMVILVVASRSHK